MNYTQHPLSAAFPAMSDAEYQALQDSISINGVLNSITIFEGMVIDGWHRYQAANGLGMDCPSQEMDDSIDPIDYVKAQNENRRHLTASQRAAAIVSIYKWTPSNIGRPRGEVASPLEKTNEELAVIAGTTKRTIQQAKAADKAGLIDAVKEGALTVEQAAKIASGKPAGKPEKFTPPAQDDELAEAAQAIGSLSEEVEVLKAELAVKHMEATGEEKSQAATLIADLRAELKSANAELEAMRTSRDGLQRENRELMKQIAIYQRQLKQAQKA